MSGTITGLEIQKQNKNRVNIYLDGSYAFSLDVMGAAPLRKGQHLTDADIARLRQADEVAQAYESAIRFLGNRPRSSNEVRRKLAGKNTPDAVIEIVITRLEAAGYINDLEFARYWVRNREESRPRGSIALRAELRERGVPPAIIDEVLAEQDAVPLALRAAEKKVQSLRGTDRQTFRRKLSGFLMRRGFDYETVRTVVETLIETLESTETADGASFFRQNVDDLTEE
jgi:regulatory protein